MDLDIYFYIYLVITILLLFMTAIILTKSTSRVNVLFSITPLLFSLILVFNMLNYFLVVPPFLLWLPYLLAPTGMVFAAWYIIYGTELAINKVFFFLQSLYLGFALFSSLYLQLIYPSQDTQIIALNHLILTLPLCLAAIQYYNMISIIPEEKIKIYALDFGIVLVMLGTFLRSMSYLLLKADLVPGLVIIILGTFLVLVSFTNILQPNRTELAKKVTPLNV